MKAIRVTHVVLKFASQIVSIFIFPDIEIHCPLLGLLVHAIEVNEDLDLCSLKVIILTLIRKKKNLYMEAIRFHPNQ